VNAETVYSGRREAGLVMTSPHAFGPISVQKAAASGSFFECG
jgi:hypothetical protein